MYTPEASPVSERFNSESFSIPLVRAVFPSRSVSFKIIYPDICSSVWIFITSDAGLGNILSDSEPYKPRGSFSIPVPVPVNITAVVETDGSVILNEFPETETVELFRAFELCEMNVSPDGNEDLSLIHI